MQMIIIIIVINIVVIITSISIMIIVIVHGVARFVRLRLLETRPGQGVVAQIAILVGTG